ncbi:MAG TPA: cytochrome c oxidase subunit II [Kiloniellales bacterium]|nr:cytochrome c oxidase subunit II [Kiloniellales bacterium]
MMTRLWIAVLALVAGLGLPGAQSALAIDAVNWGLGLQEAATPVAEDMHRFHDLLLYIIIAIVIFVLGLLIYVMVRFREKRNPVPSRTVHNTLIEVIWTAVPVAILVAIAFPSFDLLYLTHDSRDAQMNVKIYGNTWNWTYEYPDHGNFSFTANMIPAEDLKPGEPRNLATDALAVIPSGTKIRFIVTSNDTLHAFAMPAWGVKIDAVPGRLNETWAEIPAKYENHIFYGQCSELCGVGHAFMPLAIKVVSPAEFEQWVAEAKAQYGSNEPVSAPAPVSVAAGQ